MDVRYKRHMERFVYFADISSLKRVRGSQFYTKWNLFPFFSYILNPETSHWGTVRCCVIVGGHHHALVVLAPKMWPGTLYTGGSVRPRTGLDGCGNSRPHWNTILRTCSFEQVAIRCMSVFLNRRAAARYRALASIIPDRERPEETTICYKILLVQLITKLNLILYLSTCHTVYISVLILFMIVP